MPNTLDKKESDLLHIVGQAHYETAMFYKRVGNEVEQADWFHSAFKYGDGSLKAKLIRLSIEEKNTSRPV